MKLRAMMAMAAVMETTALARESALADERKVTVCMERGAGADIENARWAQAAASKTFAGIGVKIEWNRRSSCPSEALRISLSDSTPAKLLPGALAYALPHERTQIVVFYDRLQKTIAPDRVQCLLANVLVHEITHILEGVNRHSESGVMKAYWDEKELSKMDAKPLLFTDDDVILIHGGLEDRAAHPIAER